MPVEAKLGTNRGMFPEASPELPQGNNNGAV